MNQEKDTSKELNIPCEKCEYDPPVQPIQFIDCMICGKSRPVKEVIDGICDQCVKDFQTKGADYLYQKYREQIDMLRGV